MASSITLYTLGNMNKAVVDSVTSAAAGFPKENLMDFNPDVYWKATTTGDQVIDIDLKSAKSVDAVILWIQNYTTAFGSGSYTAASSPDDITYTGRFSKAIGTPNTPLIFPVETGTFSFRYWRITFSFMGAVANVSGIFICQKFTIAQGNEWPETDAEIYHNRAFSSAGGRTFVQAINSNKVEQFPRTYQLDQTKMTILQNVFNDSKGSRFPLILQEGALASEARLVRFAQNELNENQIDYQLYRPTVQFLTAPYIPAGETF